MDTDAGNVIMKCYSQFTPTIHFPTQYGKSAPVLGSELPSLSAIARTEDRRSESEVASEILGTG